MSEKWPAIAYPDWKETCDALHLYCQIVGKYRISHAPWLNHSWQATLYPNARGFTTGLVPDGAQSIELVLDLTAHRVVGTSTSGGEESFAIGPMSAARFFEETKALVTRLGGTPRINGRPNEIADGVPFAQDTMERPYDAEAANRFFRAMVAAAEVLHLFRTGFLGKASPVHLFWGSFDLTVTRFSGRAAPRHPGGIPALPDAITREAYSHEESSAGFWAGAGIGFPAFYSYVYPAPDGFKGAKVKPAAAYFDATLGEFILPYEAVRTAADPQATLLAFLESTYRAAADLARWDREALEGPTGRPDEQRPV